MTPNEIALKGGYWLVEYSGFVLVFSAEINPTILE